MRIFDLNGIVIIFYHFEIPDDDIMRIFNDGHVTLITRTGYSYAVAVNDDVVLVDDPDNPVFFRIREIIGATYDVIPGTAGDKGNHPPHDRDQ